MHIFIKTRVIIFCLLFSLFAVRVSAQFGIKASFISPGGDLGQFYNKGISADIFYIQKDDDGPWRKRAGIFYTKLSPRLDTVPVYAIQTGGNTGTAILPGYLVDHDLSMLYLYIDIGYRIVKFKKFSFYAGAGLEGGFSKVQYDRGYESALVEQANNELKIAGYRVTANLEYKISSHFEILFEAVENRMRTTSGSTKYEHHTFGLGVDYFIKAEKKHHKSKYKHD